MQTGLEIALRYVSEVLRSDAGRREMQMLWDKVVDACGVTALVRCLSPDGWMDGWMNGCMDGWMDGWMDGKEVGLFAGWEGCRT